VTAPGERLLPAPPSAVVAGLERLQDLLAAAFPLRPKHRATLPRGVAELSALLTTDRDDLPRDYMSRPAHLAAYLHWFLPWNVYRLGRLLAGLPLPLAADARIIDLGAGPLTFPLALWLARPELQAKPLNYVAIDRAEAALRVGRDLFAALAGDGGAPWRIMLRPGPLTGRPAPADLVVAANVLNELGSERGVRRKGPEVSGPERLVRQWERLVAPAGRLLLVEPGVRVAAAQLVRVREAALARGWSVVAPCTHGGACPLPGARSGGWCHFAFDTGGAPRWLESLGRAAHLPKERASLSFLLLAVPDGGGAFAADPAVLRVVSEAFPLPDGRHGCYACGEGGLALLTAAGPPAAARLAPGDRVHAPPPARPRRDPKSGAAIIPLS
jgi:SAM-dependent methyltransferase